MRKRWCDSGPRRIHKHKSPGFRVLEDPSRESFFDFARKNTGVWDMTLLKISSRAPDAVRAFLKTENFRQGWRGQERKCSHSGIEINKPRRLARSDPGPKLFPDEVRDRQIILEKSQWACPKKSGSNSSAIDPFIITCKNPVFVIQLECSPLFIAI